jgi:hypothetical protein
LFTFAAFSASTLPLLALTPLRPALGGFILLIIFVAILLVE